MFDRIVEDFCQFDDFCQAFYPRWEARLLTEGLSPSKKRGPQAWLADSEIMTILVLYHSSQFKNFKAFYEGVVLALRAYQKSCVRDRFHLIPLFDAEPIAEHDGELCHGGGPFALGILPTVAHTAQDQIQQFGCSLVGREVSAAANGGAQCAVEALDRIGGIDDPPHLWREGEEWDQRAGRENLHSAMSGISA